MLPNQPSLYTGTKTIAVILNMVYTDFFNGEEVIFALQYSHRSTAN